MFRPALFFSLCALAVANAQSVTNDWSVPCHTGTCSYDIPSTGTGSGSLHISGSSTAISDITTASGWTIVDCNSNALAQTIRMVCTDASAGCSHVESGSGAAGKLVRLPESCGKGPFARVASMGVANDQSVPANIAARFARRGEAHQVKSVVLDSNYSAIDPKANGPISFTFSGNNHPSTIAPAAHKRSFFGDLGNDIKGAAGSVASAVAGAADTAATAVKGALGGAAAEATSVAGAAVNAGGALATKAASAVSSAATDVANAAGAANDVNVSKNLDLPPITFNKEVNLLNIQANCGPVAASFTANLNGNANATVSVGINATGTIVPPKFTDFTLNPALDANLDGLLTLNGDASATGSSGTITLFTIGIPGLDIPGILTLGPSFKIDASVDATVDLGLNMTVGLNYQVQNAQATIPPNKDTPSSGLFAPFDTPLSLAATPGLTGGLSMTAHLTPTLDFGINALDNVANVDVFLALDASATLNGNLTGSAGTLSTAIGGSQATATASSSSSTMDDSSSTSTMSNSATSTTSMSDASTSTPVSSAQASSAAQPSATGMMGSRRRYMGARFASSYERAVARYAAIEAEERAEIAARDIPITGCVDVGAAFNVNVGANGDLFDIINKNTQDTLFSKSFTLFTKCFNGAIPTRRELRRLPRRSVPRRSQLVSRANALTCQPFTTSGTLPSALTNIVADAKDILNTAK